jgi:thymidylate kinase
MKFPQLVVFEGPDGAGKSSVLAEVTRKIKDNHPDINLLEAAFPGKEHGTLGYWVMEFHNGRISGLERPDPVALQILHLAAHVDQIRKTILPHLAAGGHVLLDRSWMSTYAYSRRHLDQPNATALIEAELPFWFGSAVPQFLVMTRTISLKPDENTPEEHEALGRFYLEAVEIARKKGASVQLVNNDGNQESTHRFVFDFLGVE